MLKEFRDFINRGNVIDLAVLSSLAPPNFIFFHSVFFH
jgi:hypothetical protein